METEKGYLYGVQQLIGVTRPSGTQSEWWFVANAVHLNVASPSLDGVRAGAGGHRDNAPWE